MRQSGSPSGSRPRHLALRTETNRRLEFARENDGLRQLRVTCVKEKADSSPVPLCIDCDGTLLRTDLLHEAVFLLAKQAPGCLLLLPLWLLRGKPYMKQQIAARVCFNFDSLPVRDEVVALVAAARAQGRRTVLATASPRPWAEGVAARVGLFDDVIATDEHVNLSGRASLQAKLGKGGRRCRDRC